MTTFAGRWLTLFGPMDLTQDAKGIRGTYWYQGVASVLEGKLIGDRFVFRYQDPSGAGEGWFECPTYGQLRGRYRLVGSDNWQDWTGHREWDGLWDASYGRIRLVQEANGMHGTYEGSGPSRMEGKLDGKRFTLRFIEPGAQGDAWFDLADNAMTFTGRWRYDGATAWGEWTGRRVSPQPGLTWLVVIEAQWQRSLADGEYSYGNMLREFFARLPHVAVRQRYFNDEASLLRWCRELNYVVEPAIVLISSHGSPDGVKVHGHTVNPGLVVNALREACNIKLLHFAACSMLNEEKAGDFARRIQAKVPYPISGYTTSVDWGGSAISEFGYFDMILGKGLTPAEAAERLPGLITYAGEKTPSGSPYVGLGFRFFK